MVNALDIRKRWVAWTERVAEPVLAAGAAGDLKAHMPVEFVGERDRRPFTHLEAVGRLLMGLAPWLELNANLVEHEAAAQQRYRALAQQTLTHITHPIHADYCNWTNGNQPCVDAAFLAQAMLRAPKALFESLAEDVRGCVIEALRQTRVCHAPDCNWLLFKAIIEAALFRFAGQYEPQTVAYAVERHAAWYVGDGTYGDGPQYHADYYNSFVIQPMLLETLETLADERDTWAAMLPIVKQRAVRYAAIQERMINPDGTFPPLGRSLCYRGGAFGHLAMMAWRDELPEGVTPAQVRGALDAVMQKTLDAPGTFDDAGWLRLGLAGYQPGLAEGYISTGSLYLCSAALVPLGLAPQHAFWQDADVPWTSRRIWSGQDHLADHALHDPA